MRSAIREWCLRLLLLTTSIAVSLAFVAVVLTAFFRDDVTLDGQPSRGWVNYWFQTSNGANRDAFIDLLKPANLDRLAEEGGVSSHLGAGSFTHGDAVDPEVEARIRDLASRAGWFAPASDILDFLRMQPGWTGDPGRTERIGLGMRFSAGGPGGWRLVGLTRLASALY